MFYRLKQLDFDGTSSYSKEIEVNNSFSEEFTLYQNYPNPFNSTTKIKYSLPVECNVSVSIINSIGETIQTIKKKAQNAGYHELDFDTGNLSSGIYFYIVEANVIDGSKIYKKANKMLLLK